MDTTDDGGATRVRRSRSLGDGNDTSLVIGHTESLPARVHLLRGFELCVGPRAIPLASNAQRLVAFLAVRERPQRRATVAGALWIDAAEDRASANLRTALWKIRSLGARLIRTTASHLALDPKVEVDLTMFLAQARRLIGPGDTFEDCDASPDLLVGDLLPDWDEDWILFERERLRQLRVHALEALCGRLSRCGRHRCLAGVDRLGVAAEPLRESAQRVLISAHLAEGNVCEARRQFELYRSLLWDSLKLSPAVDLFELTGASLPRTYGELRRESLR